MHIADRTARDFIDSVQNNTDSSHIPEIPVDSQLSSLERTEVFGMLERYLKSQSWSPHFTFITVADGVEDSADCYFQGSNGDWILLMVAHYYQERTWQLDAYEIPERAFARPENESFEDYLLRSMQEARATAKPYHPQVVADGNCYIDHPVTK